MNTTINPKRELRYSDQAATTFKPNGDRYLVEIVPIDDSVFAGATKLIMPPSSEVSRGFRAGVVVACGDGHRLETDVTVPMFYGEGEVVILERLTGRELTFQGKKFVIVNQVDVLGSFPAMKGYFGLL